MASRLPFRPKTHTQLDDRVGQRLALYRAKCFFFSLSESWSQGSPCPLGRGGQRRVTRNMELQPSSEGWRNRSEERGGEGLTMLVPSSSERRCCRSNQRVWNKTQRCLGLREAPKTATWAPGMQATSRETAKMAPRAEGTRQPQHYSPWAPRARPSGQGYLASKSTEASERTLEPVSQGNGRVPYGPGL